MTEAIARQPKYQRVYGAILEDIRSGRWKRGDRLPSESELVRIHGASRITVGRAMKELQAAGVVERRAGSGTFVKAASPGGAHAFGLLIPDLGETEVFEPICQGMLASPLARQHALLWGGLSSSGDGSKAERALQLGRQYIDRGVSGVFFAPLEFAARKDDVNLRIARMLDEARIPVVLLDRTVVPYPRRGHHDLVGIDNRRAGYVIAEHLIRLGCRRVAFAAQPDAAATVDAREAGYREALYTADLRVDRALIGRLDPGDAAAVGTFVETGRPDGIVCANDRTAARLMHTLLALGYAVPRDVRVVGIDDVPYAALLPVPLTTLHQPTRQIGEAALAAMLERLSRPELPARDILLHCELVVRASCGARPG